MMQQRTEGKRRNVARDAGFAGAGLALLLSACVPDAPTPAPGAPQAQPGRAPGAGAAQVASVVPAAAATIAGPAASAEVPGVPIRMRVEDPRVGTEVGVRSPGMGLATSGRAGWLVFGGYSPLPAGRYEALVQGFAQPGHAGMLYADVAAGKGTEIVTSVEVGPDALDAHALAGALVVVPFELTSARSDIEVRLRVTPASRAIVSGFEIRARP